MGRWKTEYVTGTKREVFKTTYILCSIFNFLALLNLWRMHFHDTDFNKSKWLGGLLGTIQNTGVLVLVYCLCNLCDLQALGIILFVLHIIYLVLFGILYKTK